MVGGTRIDVPCFRVCVVLSTFEDGAAGHGRRIGDIVSYFDLCILSSSRGSLFDPCPGFITSFLREAFQSFVSSFTAVEALNAIAALGFEDSSFPFYVVLIFVRFITVIPAPA